MDASASAAQTAGPATTAPVLDAAAESVNRHDPDRGAFYARYLVVVIVDRSRRLPKRLVSVHVADTFDTLCKARLEEDMGLQVQPTSIVKVSSLHRVPTARTHAQNRSPTRRRYSLQAFFDLQGEWIRVDSTSDTIKTVLQQFPECRSIRFEVFTNELSAMELKPLRPPPKRNIWLSAAIFVVKTVLAYEVIASVADFALRSVGVKGASKEDEEQSAFDDVLRALQRMDSEELEKLNQRWVLRAVGLRSHAARLDRRHAEVGRRCWPGWPCSARARLLVCWSCRQWHRLLTIGPPHSIRGGSLHHPCPAPDVNTGGIRSGGRSVTSWDLKRHCTWRNECRHTLGTG
jgi:hypothetical protein